MISDLALASGLVLGAVLIWAALVKLARPAATRVSFDALGLPAAGVLALAVPVVEALCAVAVVLRPAVGGWFALTLLVAFTGFVAKAIRSGTAAPCSCFGSSRSDPVSSTDIVRNVLLISLALVATGAPVGRPALPTLAALIVVTTAVAAGRVLLAVLDLRRSSGGPLFPDAPGSSS